MSSWKYAFLFPYFQNQLSPAKAVERLTELGARFDNRIRMCIPIDSEGHMLDVGDEITLNAPVEYDLIQFVKMRKSFSIQLRNSSIMVSIRFILESSNPHIVMGWPSRLFNTMPPNAKLEFWKWLRIFARDCDAGYVVVIDDAPDHFEDRFVEIDGMRVLDFSVSHPYGLGLNELWLNTSLRSSLPAGPTYGNSEEIGDGFVRYSIGNHV